MIRLIDRRLRRLEERCGPAFESWQTRRLRERLDAARLRRGLPPISPVHLAELRGKSIVEILHSGRQRAAARARESGKYTEQPGEAREAKPEHHRNPASRPETSSRGTPGILDERFLLSSKTIVRQDRGKP